MGTRFGDTKKNRRSKTMDCGHTQTWETPIPQAGDYVWCFSCHQVRRIPPRLKKSRAKENPRGNNQFTPGRHIPRHVEHAKTCPGC